MCNVSLMVCIYLARPGLVKMLLVSISLTSYELQVAKKILNLYQVTPQQIAKNILSNMGQPLYVTEDWLYVFLL